MNTHVILLVDDNVDDVQLALWAFNKIKLNVEIIVARDGSEALDLLLPADRAQRLRPAIVLWTSTCP
jgi:hypothetical protein